MNKFISLYLENLCIEDKSYQDELILFDKASVKEGQFIGTYS